MGPGNMATAFNEPSYTRQGQEALDLAQPAAHASSGGLSLSNLGLNLAFGTTNHNKASSSPTSTIRMHHLQAGMALNKQSQPPSDTFGSVAAAIAAANAVGQSGTRVESTTNSGINVSALDLNGTGTIRQSHFKAGVVRSMSHHRGQSAVCPQDLELSNDGITKRKRASWDGGLV
jgi:hypothetical protein